MPSEPALSFELHVEGARAEVPRLSLSLDLPLGTSVLFGPSGAGKSTCLLALAGLISPARGHIRLGSRVLFDRERVVDVPTHARQVALVFQSLALFPHLSVLENVAFGIPARFPRRERRERSLYWLERMHVASLASRATNSLSGGEAQRVALARALASEPKLLLLDEPFSALDHKLRRALAHEVIAVIAELAIPALLVTHDREEAQSLGERIVALRAGRLDAAD